MSIPKGGNMKLIQFFKTMVLLSFLIVPGAGILNSQHVPKAPKPGDEVKIIDQTGKYIPLDLSFTDSNGKKSQLKDIIKKPTVLTLVYYHCTTVCMPLLGAVTDVLDRVDLVPGKDYEVITISFNERETPEKAKNIKDNFIKRFSKPFPEEAWTYMVGDIDNIHKLTDSLGYYYKRDGEDFIHPTGIFMISPNGKITRLFYGVSYLPFDVKMGIIEAAKGKTGPAISRALLFCFKYDPEGKRYVFNILKVTATITLMFLFIFVVWLLLYTRHKRKKALKKE